MGLSHRAVYQRTANQFGVISRNQALEAGMSPGKIAWALRSGSWATVHPGVYRLAG